jgi:anti-sigma regulatory factor (Ser/Thr protein kinase)
MSMGVEIERVVKDLGKVTIEQVLQEAIMNSIQAKADNIDIQLKYTNLGKDMPFSVNQLIISDNGEGFTKENTKSFEKYKSTHKQKFGAKGIGRFLFLKLFDKVSIDSLDKNIKFDINDVKVANRIDDNSKKTIINFLNPNDVFIKLDNIENNIKEHFLPYFHLMKTRKEQEIKISLTANGENIFMISSINIPNFKTDTFQVKRHKFTINYILDHYENSKNNCFYCADDRVVLKNNTTQKQKPQLTKLKSFNDVNILFLLSGKYLNTKVIDSRDNFEIYPKNKKSMFEELSWDDIQDKLNEKLKKILLDNGIDIEHEAKEKLNTAKEKAPYLSKYLTDNPYAKSSEKLIESAEKILYEDKKILRENKHKSQQEYNQKLSRVTHTELAEYIFDRQKIIDNLKKITNENILEKEIHNLFMKKNTTDSNENYRSNNLWLFDDRFMVYDNVFSDKHIKDIFPELSDNLKRPDLLSIVSNTYNKDKITDIVIIELKRPNDKITPMGAEEQLIDYASYVNSTNSSSKIRIWAYAFLKFNNDTCRRLTNNDYNKIPTQSKYEIYYKYNKASNVIINFMDYKALADDANTRNKTFMNILNKKS